MFFGGFYKENQGFFMLIGWVATSEFTTTTRFFFNIAYNTGYIARFYYI